MTQTARQDAGADRITRICHAIASVALVVMMLVVVTDVSLRFAFNTPVRGAYDVVSIGLLTMVFFGIAPVVAGQSEILIDLIDAIVPSRGLRVLRTSASIATLVVFLFLGWSMFGPARDAWRYGDRSLELGIPLWGLWLVAFIGLTGIIWASLKRVAGLCRARQRQLPEKDATS